MLVKNRLQLLSAILLIGLIVIGVIAFNNARTWSSDMHQIGEERVPALLSLGNVNTERMSIRAQTFEVLILDSNKKNTKINNPNKITDSYRGVNKTKKRYIISKKNE